MQDALRASLRFLLHGSRTVRQGARWNPKRP